MKKSWVLPVAVGFAASGSAALMTAAYLSSITIDDGLEGLIFLPLVALTDGVAAFVLVLYGRRWGMAFAAAGASVAWFMAGMCAWGAVRELPMLVLAALASAPIPVAFAAAGAAVGGGVAEVVRRLR